jgi:hypothetical protein
VIVCVAERAETTPKLGRAPPTLRLRPVPGGPRRDATTEEAPKAQINIGFGRGVLTMRCTNTAAPAAAFAKLSWAPARGAWSMLSRPPLPTRR